MTKMLVLAFGLLVAMGCELPETDNPADARNGGQPGGDAAEWAAIQWHGEAASGTTQVMTLSASISGDRVHFSWDRWPWGSKSELGHFFVWTGNTWKGGKFEWIRANGQPVKLLENIRNGYNGLSVPRSGTPVAFAWTSADGTQRSNLARTVWP